MSVHDQGERPTCLAFAVTAAHELIRAGSAAVNEDLSEEALYWGGKQLDKGVRDGTSFSAAQGALQQWGQPLEAVWPYDPLRDESRLYRPPSGVRPGSRGWHRAGLRRIRHTVSSLRRELASERIVALGLMLTRGFHLGVSGREMTAKDTEEFADGFLKGIGLHPEATSREIVALAPQVTLIERWKEPEHHAAVKTAVERFLAEHTPR